MPRISEISKEINIPSKEIIAFLDEKGVAGKTASSGLDDDQKAMVVKHFAKPAEKTEEKKTAAKEPVKVAAPASSNNAMQKPLQKPVSTISGAPKTSSNQHSSISAGPQQGRQMLSKPAQGQQPQRRTMFDSQEQRDKAVQKTQRTMFDNPEQRDKAQQKRPMMSNAPKKTMNNGGSRIINGVKISSDDSDSRLRMGSHNTQAIDEATRKRMAEAKQKRLEQEKEQQKLDALKEAEQNELAAKARKEAEQIKESYQHSEELKARFEAQNEAKLEKDDLKASTKDEEFKTESKSGSPATADSASAPSKAEEAKPVEKVLKDPNAGNTKVNVLRKINLSANAKNSKPSDSNQRNQSDRRPFSDRQNGNNRNGERRDFGNRDQRNNQGRTVDKGHFQEVGSRHDGKNDGHSNLFARPQDSFRNNNQSQNRPQNNRGGFSVKPQGYNPMGSKDDDDEKKTFQKRNPVKKSSGGNDIVAEAKSKNTRKADNKSKDIAKENKRTFEFEDGMRNKNGKGKMVSKKDPNRAGAFQKPVAVKVEEEEVIKTIILPETLTIQELADKMKKKPAELIKKLFLEGKMVSQNQDITYEEAEEIALGYEILCEHEPKVDRVAELLKEDEEDEKKMVKRPPVVCVMGHVDHGKTSLLDAIRSTQVTAREAGGITQHIGAYMVEINGEKITFLDTPGHEAFTAMRMRGANSTDIAVLVVAADDGVMPQTVEAINHAKAAGVELIVAVNKIDKPTANIDRVKQELTEYGLIAEDWGGSTIFVPVSARTHEGIDNLLENIILTSEVMELKANPNRNARGIVIEAKLDKGRGPVATVLVQKGTLKVGDHVVIGSSMGKVRALINDKHEKVKHATPSMPIEVLGLDTVPDAGEIVVGTASEKEAREISEAYISQNKEKLVAETKSKMSLDGLFSQIKAGSLKELNIIVKADVQGSVEAIKQSLVKLSNDEVVVRIIHGGVGAINESDATLASASNAIIIGFNVKPDNTAKDICEHEKVDLRLYSVIYNAIDDVEAAMKGLLDPVFEEKIIAHAEVRQTFKASGVGMIAGSYVLDGKIVRGCKARVSREGKQLFEGNLASLKRFKDDVKEVNAGYECGLVFDGFQDLMVGDSIELYQMVEVPR